MKRLVSLLAIALASVACLPAGAQAAFGINSFDVAFSSTDGSPATQAGSHPYAFTTSLGMNSDGTEPEGRLRELFLDLPPGLVLSTTAVPHCGRADFETLNEGINDCSDGTAVGIFQAASGDPENWTTAPVFSLAPPSGALIRLGFRVAGANVVVDFELSSEPPYRLLVSVSEIPEAIELLAVKLQLWGVPAAPAHDDERGRCALDDVEGSCPTNNSQRPLLTLPTSCEGPQATFYEAFSWEGDEDFGDDRAGDPPGFGGCHKLAFSPFLSAQPTTEEAQSPTGLDASIAFSNAGLFNPTGIAESQIRDLAAALSGGVAPGPLLTSATGSCSKTNLEAETPESAGCPVSSNIGTAEVESPLVEGQVIHGAIYRATPYENFAGDAAAALYVVLKDSGLGVSIAQPVALEADPATGELIAIAEDMPQLPFNHLRLHLDDGEGGPLVSPPLCGKYGAETELDPWAGEGTFGTLSAFQIVSGPNGGPCPTGVPEAQSETGLSTPAAGGPAAGGTVASHWHRCPKGKHRARRKGKVRCVRKPHRKHHRRHRHLR